MILPRLHPIARAALLLGGFALLGLGLVALVHDRTEQRIAANERAVLLHTLEILVPPDRFDNDILGDTLTVSDPALGSAEPVAVYRARKDGQPVAAVLSVTAPDGYNGAIRLLLAVQADGTLMGVRILSHHETPGLGDAIEIGKSRWILGFAGRSLNNPPAERWAVKKDGGDFDQFTGATITPRAVVQAVYGTLEFFRAQRRTLFDATPE
jgi:electron transport complex protein RnfG